MTKPTNDLEALADRLDALPHINHARLTPIGVEDAYIISGAFRDTILTTLRSIAAPKQDGEPVAWIIYSPNGDASDLCRVGLTEADKKNGFTADALYLHPSPKAADGELLAAINAEIDTWEQVPMRGC